MSETKSKPPRRSIYWASEVPDVCSIGGEAIRASFVDGRTQRGAWAIMCLKCARTDGVGLGLGKGQMFRKQPNNTWLKTEG